jgi:ubiquinone/menaquinone biosynthesis C-methylase UbiE
MLALDIERLTSASAVLDVGCRDASHLIELVRATGARSVGLDPVSRFVEQARKAIGDAGLSQRVEIIQGVMRHIPFPDGSFDLAWCRDVITVVEDDLGPGMAEIARVLRPADT